MNVVVIEDEDIQRVALEDDLRDAGHDVRAFAHPEEALEAIASRPPDVVLCDLRLPGISGMDVLKQVRERWPDTAVVMVTAYATVESAVEAMRLGAYDYLTKPFNRDAVEVVLDRLGRFRRALDENRELRRQLSTTDRFEGIVFGSEAMRAVVSQVEVAARSDATVLITGETGVGKEVVADAIHARSTRREGPCVKVACAMLSREVLESELFGHEQGAFTGATRRRIGRFELAHRGTIFLDEIDDVPLDLQVKLLRVLEDRRVERVGGTHPVEVDVRVIAATKKDLRELVDAGRFREDLYYRLNVLPIDVPPLRRRPDDVAPLFDHFLRRYSAGSPPDVDSDVYRVLRSWRWPGNVRELRNLVERLTLVCNCRPVRASCLPEEMQRAAQADGAAAGVSEGHPPPGSEGAGPSDGPEDLPTDLPTAVARFEASLVRAALERAGGNRARAAEMLGVPVTTLKSKIRRLGLD